MNVLGIDLGLKRTGLCWREGEELRSLAVTPVFAAETVEARDARVSHIVRAVYDVLHRDPGIEWVWIEGWAFGHLAARGNNMARTIELGGAIKFELFRRFGLHVRSVPVATARLLVLGNGGLNKKQAQLLAHKQIKDETWVEDEVDAYVIMRAGELATAIKDEWWGSSSTQRKALDRLRDSAGIGRPKARGAA